LWNSYANVSGFIFGTNNTGSWVNQTYTKFSTYYTSTSAWGSYTTTLDSTVGDVVQWEEWCNDTGNNWANTGLQSLTVTVTNTIGPTFGYVTTDNLIAGQKADITASIYDNVAVSMYVFSWNNTGSWANQTTSAFSSNPATFSGTLNSTVGNTVQIEVYANDTSNNWAVSSIFSFVLTNSSYDARIFSTGTEEATDYYFNSPMAGFYFRWNALYWFYVATGSPQIRCDSASSYNLCPEYSACVQPLWWEYKSYTYFDSLLNPSQGQGTTTVERNATDYSLVREDWTNALINQTMYMAFWSDRPYVWTYLLRMPLSNQTVFNTQTLYGFPSFMADLYYTSYNGTVVEYANTPIQALDQDVPLFAAINNGVATQYPWWAVYNSTINVTTGYIAVSATPNEQNDLAFSYTAWTADQFMETKLAWNENTAPTNELRNGEVMGLELLYFVHSGSPLSTGNINDTATQLYNTNVTSTNNVTPDMYSATNQRYGNEPAGSYFVVGVRGYNAYVANSISDFPNVYYIPYMANENNSEYTTYPFVGTDYDLPFYSNFNWAYDSSSQLLLDDRTVNEASNSTSQYSNWMTGMIEWNYTNQDVYEYVNAYLNSDKLLYYGNVTLNSDTYCLNCSFVFYNRQATAVQITTNEYDFRWNDPDYGPSGIYLKVNSGTSALVNGGVAILLANYSTPQLISAGTTFSYNFTIWGHSGNATSMTSFFTLEPLTYKDTFSNYYLSNSDVAFQTNGNYQVCEVTDAASSVSFMIYETSNSQTVPVYVYLNGRSVSALTLEGTNPSYTVSNGILSFNTTYACAYAFITLASGPETQPPSYSNVGYNTTLVNSPCLFHCQWQDNSGLSGYIFSTNNTGTWVNDTWVSMSSNPAWANVTKTLSSTGNLIIGYRWYCNDTSNNWGDTGIFTLTTISGGIPPTYSNIQVNTTIASNPCQFSSYWQDGAGLSGFIFSTNNTGTWVNDTYTGFAGLTGWANVTKTLNGTVGDVIGYQWYCNDTSNNWNLTGIQTLTTTYSAPPQYSNVSYSSTEQSSPCVFSSFWTDDQALGGYIFGTNVTGTWTNDTFSALSGQQGWANVTKTLPSVIGATVEFQYWCNDSQNQWTTTGLLYLVTTPGQPPAYSNVGYNSTIAGSTTLLSCYWQDTVGLSGFIFSWNGTGTWTNNTWIALGGTAGWSNVTKTLTSTVGSIIGFEWYCNDTDNNWNYTQIQTFTTTAAAQTAVFGKTSIGASPNTLPIGYVIACRFQAPANGTATQISAYIHGKYGAGQSEAMIYSDINGTPGSLLFESGQIALSTNWAWYNFSVNYKIQSGQYYWFAIFSSVEAQFTFDAGATKQQAAAWGWAFPSVPTNFNGIYGPIYANDADSIYVTYSPQ
jgi:hypothetical protein